MLFVLSSMACTPTNAEKSRAKKITIKQKFPLTPKILTSSFLDALYFLTNLFLFDLFYKGSSFIKLIALMITRNMKKILTNLILTSKITYT